MALILSFVWGFDSEEHQSTPFEEATCPRESTRRRSVKIYWGFSVLTPFNLLNFTSLPQLLSINIFKKWKQHF